MNVEFEKYQAGVYVDCHRFISASKNYDSHDNILWIDLKDIWIFFLSHDGILLSIGLL